MLRLIGLGVSITLQCLFKGLNLSFTNKTAGKGLEPAVISATKGFFILQ